MSDVIPGRHFRDANSTLFGHPAPDWVVLEVFTGTDGMQYARICSAAHPQDRKTLSAAILKDKRRFIQVQASSVE